MKKYTPELIRRVWLEMRGLIDDSAIYRQVFSSPLVTVGLYCGQNKHVGVVIQSNSPLTRNMNYSNLKIDRRLVARNRWEFVLSLVNPELELQFANLCSEIINGLVENPPADGGAYLSNQLSRWSTLMKKSLTLTPEGERGLWCELHTLQKAINYYGEAKALNSWVGPESSPQDFLFDLGAVEVKSLYDKAGEVKISSLDQMDAAGNALYLVLVNLAQDEIGCTLKEKVTAVKQAFKAFPELGAIFEEKLFHNGYSEESGKVGSTTKYSAVATQWYNASSEDFPALRRHNVNPAIIKAGYTLAVAAISQFKTEEKF